MKVDVLQVTSPDGLGDMGEEFLIGRVEDPFHAIAILKGTRGAESLCGQKLALLQTKGDLECVGAFVLRLPPSQ